jgi:hypothetical protein
MNGICGKAWKFGDNIDTDIIIPACHLVLPLEEMKADARRRDARDAGTSLRSGNEADARPPLRPCGPGGLQQSAPLISSQAQINEHSTRRACGIRKPPSGRPSVEAPRDSKARRNGRAFSSLTTRGSGLPY